MEKICDNCAQDDGKDVQVEDHDIFDDISDFSQVSSLFRIILTTALTLGDNSDISHLIPFSHFLLLFLLVMGGSI